MRFGKLRGCAGGTHWGRMAPMLVCLVSVACFADDSCDSGEFHCDGRVARNCAAETRSYVSVDCASQGMECAVGREEAFCAVSSKAEPRCDTLRAWCEEDGTLVYCKDGYAVAPSGQPCPYCIETDGDAFCPLSDEPEPRCPDDEGNSTVCSENTIVSCRDGYLMGTQVCAEGRTCRQGNCMLDP